MPSEIRNRSNKCSTPDCSNLAHTGLVASDVKAACGTASNTLTASGSPNIATFKGTSSAIEKTKTDGMFFLQQQFPTKGISEPAVELLKQSWRYYQETVLLLPQAVDSIFC